MPATPYHFLANRLSQIPQAPYPCCSRFHSLKSFYFSKASCYVKREDELGFGISGSKIRKYRSLIPYLVDQQIKEVIVVGSAYSNHVLGISQLLIENSLQPTLFLRGDPERELKGNAFLSSLLVPPSSIHWFSKDQWSAVYEEAALYVQRCPHKAFVLPEGACLAEALPGALTLAIDIIRNEEEAGFSFDHLFIDSGTGLTAIALILAYSWLKKEALIHVMLMAGSEAYFLQQLEYFHTWFKTFMQTDSPFPSLFKLYHPLKAPRFGQLHKGLFQDIISLARTEGFFTDPLYTAKLFHEAECCIERLSLQGRILIIHSGGSLTLMGFEEQLRQAYQSS